MMKKMLKSIRPLAKIMAKLIFSLGLIYWLFRSGKLDFSLILDSFSQGTMWFLFFAIMMINVVLITLRWNVFLSTGMEKSLSFMKMVSLTLVGNLFNIFLPGAVSGDLIKILYVRNEDKHISKTFLLSSVIIDRVVGLIGLIFILGGFSLFHYELFLYSQPEKLKSLFYFNMMCFAGAWTLLFLLMIPFIWQQRLSFFIQRIPLMGSFVDQCIRHCWKFGEKRLVVLSTIFLSIIVQSLSMLAFFFITNPYVQYASHLQNHPSLQYDWNLGFTFMPLGFLSTSLPLAPAGLGVGHAAFNSLFAFFGISNGASLFNLYFLGTVFFALCGFVPYLFLSKKGLEQKEILGDADLDNPIFLEKSFNEKINS
jgi:uncharacterized membrane protein YbhN (UPF0104 family)